ncbi:MAG TPA: flagellar basal body P-ring formation chaperone FlgA [Verrucomicrobiae bacterium]
MKTFTATILLILQYSLLGGAFVPSMVAGETPLIQMNAVVSVSGDGVFLPQIFTAADPLPAIRLCDAPAFGKNLILSRSEVLELVLLNAPAIGTNFGGADSVKIVRRTRTFTESDLLGLVTSALQKDYVKDRGQLELRLSQAWNPLVLPDEPITLDVQDLPTVGVTSSFIVRFALRSGHETLGTWSASLRASVWREVCVASHQLKRGDAVTADTFSRERRDVLNVRDQLPDLTVADEGLEYAESISAGTPLVNHMIKARTVVHRGQTADALVQDGGLSVKTKVEILEDGAPGDFVHARNQTTRRDVTGKVINEKTILISL